MYGFWNFWYGPLKETWLGIMDRFLKSEYKEEYTKLRNNLLLTMAIIVAIMVIISKL